MEIRAYFINDEGIGVFSSNLGKANMDGLNHRITVYLIKS